MRKIPRFGKILTIIVSSIAILGSFLAILIFSLHDLGAAKLNNEAIRYYEGRYYSEGALLYETGPLKKGDPIGFNEMPVKDQDPNGDIYQFMGWDIDNNNIPDILGDRIYFNFTANALFFKIPVSKFTLNEQQLADLLNLLTNLNLELSPEQLQKLIDILTGMNIDWTDIDTDLLMRILDFLGLDLEDFMEMLGLNFEDFIGLMNAPVLSYTATDYTYPTFFRTQSYGDYNGNKWAKGDYFDAKSISEYSVNPLSYATDRVKGVLPVVNYDITYLKSGKIYPVPQYELNNTQGLNSESHSLEKPTEAPTEEYPKASKYQTSGCGFFPASSYSIMMLNKDFPYSNTAIEADELNYRSYVQSHYLNVDKKYKDYFLQLAREKGIEVDTMFYSHVSKISELFKEYQLYELNPEEMKSYPAGSDKVMYFMEEAKAGLSSHFATATTLFYRSLGIPARYVEGYFDYVLEEVPDSGRVVGGLQAHSWVEIYIDHIGWMMVDTSISNALPPQLANLIFGSPDVDLNVTEKRTLDHIECSVTKEHYFTGSTFDKKDLTITAYYTNDTTSNIETKIEDEEDKSIRSLTIHVPSFDTQGTKTIKVIYIENGKPSVAKVTVEVEDPAIIKLDVISDSYQSVYLPNNILKLEGLMFNATFNDDHVEQIPSSLVTFSETPSTEVAGHFDYEVYLTEKPEIKTTVPIDVLSEPVANLKSIKNKSTKGYSVIVNGTFDASQLLFEATYEDNTYRDVTNETGTFTIEGDFSTIGMTTARITYEERGSSVTVEIQIRVRSIAEDVVFKINQTKVYDGKPFDFANAVTLEDASGQEIEVLAENERLDAVFYKTNCPDGENFTDVGNYTFFIKFRIINEFGTVLTEDYMSSATKITVFPSDEAAPTEFEFGTEDFNVDEEGFIDLSGMQFHITPKELNVTTFDLTYNKTTSEYFYQDMLISNDLSSYMSVVGLAEGDTYDPTAIAFNAPSIEENEDENSFNVSTFVITSAERGKVVTSNYIIKTTWGKLTIIS